MTQQDTKFTLIESETQALISNILGAGSWLDTELHRHYSKFGLTTPQFNVMRILRTCHPNAMSVGIVQSNMLEKSSNVTRLVQKLREKGYVTQFPNAINKRIQELRITSLGLDALEKVEQEERKIAQKFNHLKPEEISALTALLVKVKHA